MRSVQNAKNWVFVGVAEARSDSISTDPVRLETLAPETLGLEPSKYKKIEASHYSDGAITYQGTLPNGRLVDVSLPTLIALRQSDATKILQSAVVGNPKSAVYTTRLLTLMWVLTSVIAGGTVAGLLSMHSYSLTEKIAACLLLLISALSFGVMIRTIKNLIE